MKLRKLQISDPLWWGFNRYIDLERFNSVNSLIEYFVLQLENFLKEHNLLEQYDKFKLIKHRYHIHGPYDDNHNHNHMVEYNFLLNTSEDDTIYICRHDNPTNLDNILHQHN